MDTWHFLFVYSADVWVLGDSIPHWAGSRAVDTGKRNLCLPGTTHIGWWGVWGLTWSRLREVIQVNVTLNVPPRIIFIHLGGNDIVDLKTTAIINAIEREVSYLRAAFPQTTIVWVDILDRLSWGLHSYSPKQLKKKLKRINDFGRQQVRQERHQVLTMDITPETKGFYYVDGVHLSDVGLEMYLDFIRDTILELS